MKRRQEPIEENTLRLLQRSNDGGMLWILLIAISYRNELSPCCNHAPALGSYLTRYSTMNDPIIFYGFATSSTLFEWCSSNRPSPILENPERKKFVSGTKRSKRKAKQTDATLDIGLNKPVGIMSLNAGILKPDGTREYADGSVPFITKKWKGSETQSLKQSTDYHPSPRNHD